MLREFFNEDYNDYLVQLLATNQMDVKEPYQLDVQYDEKSYILLKNEDLKNLRLLLIDKLNCSNPKFQEDSSQSDLNTIYQGTTKKARESIKLRHEVLTVIHIIYSLQTR